MSITSKLDRFICRHRNEPLSWGSHDCCLFACDWLRIACGVDPAKELRGSYSTWSTAVRCVRRLGFSSLLDLADELGARSALHSAPKDQACPGDIMVFTNEDPNELFFDVHLGVCLGVKSAVVGEKHLEFLKTHKAIKTFKLCPQ